MKIKAVTDFQDGNILAFKVQAGQVIEVNERENELLAQSGGQFMPAPDDDVTPVVELAPITEPAITLEQLEARHLLERQQLDAKQLKEKQAFEADEKTARRVNKEKDLHLTDSGEPQATRAVEEKVAKKVSQKRAEENQKEFDKLSKEAEAEVGSDARPEPNEKPIVVGNTKPKK